MLPTAAEKDELIEDVEVDGIEGFDIVCVEDSLPEEVGDEGQ